SVRRAEGAKELPATTCHLSHQSSPVSPRLSALAIRVRRSEGAADWKRASGATEEAKGVRRTRDAAMTFSADRHRDLLTAGSVPLTRSRRGASSAFAPGGGPTWSSTNCWG